MKKETLKQGLITLGISIVMAIILSIIFLTIVDDREDENKQVVSGVKQNLDNDIQVEDNNINNTSEKTDEEVNSNNFSKDTLEFKLENAHQSIYAGNIEVRIIDVTYDNNKLSIEGEVENNSNESITGHISKFYIKDDLGYITNLDFFSNKTFNINAPMGGKTSFEMIYEGIELTGNKITVGGEFFIPKYFGDDNKIGIEINY